MTAIWILSIAAGVGGFLFKERIVRFEQSRGDATASLLRTQIVIGSSLLLFIGFLLLAFRLSLLGV